MQNCKVTISFLLSTSNLEEEKKCVEEKKKENVFYGNWCSTAFCNAMKSMQPFAGPTAGRKMWEKTAGDEEYI